MQANGLLAFQRVDVSKPGTAQTAEIAYALQDLWTGDLRDGGLQRSKLSQSLPSTAAPDASLSNAVSVKKTHRKQESAASFLRSNAVRTRRIAEAKFLLRLGPG